MKKYKRLIIILNLALFLLYFNYLIFQKEDLLDSGQLVLLKLAPVDPRSLMQGDYMSLRYDIPAKFDFAKLSERGYCVVLLDEYGVAELMRFQEDKTPLSSGEYLIKYALVDKWNLKFGAESFFFQEGQSQKYEVAEYGGLKVDDNGNSLLSGLYDKYKKKIN